MKVTFWSCVLVVSSPLWISVAFIGYVGGFVLEMLEEVFVMVGRRLR